MGRKRTHQGPHDVPVVLPPHVLDLLGSEAGTLLAALHGPSPVSIRGNPLKPVPLPGMPIPWCAQGHYLHERPVFTLDPLLHAGAYYVQEASSMLLEQAFQRCPPLSDDAVVLDLCAAPGGKSTHLASLIPSGALLISNEPVRARQGALMENLWKWGRPNVVVAGANPEALAPLGAFCALVLVDAPCSGEGMFRKDPHARAQWGPNLVETCVQRQRHILDAAWAALKPGGHLIYSTCTWETCENEDQVQRLVGRGAEIVPIPVERAWGVQTGDMGLRCWPHRVRGEGLFIALMRKPAKATEPVGLNRRSVQQTAAVPTPVQAWLKEPDRQAVIERDGDLFAVDARWEGTVRVLLELLNLPAPGIPVAKRKGGAWQPHAALALNLLLQGDALPALHLDRGQALRYLRGESIPAESAAGMALVQFEGLPLGWANGAGKRYNNRWPARWRIRMH